MALIIVVAVKIAVAVENAELIRGRAQSKLFLF